MRLTEKFVELYHNGDSHAYISHISHTLTSAHNSAISCRHSHLNVNTSICMVCVKTLNCNFISVFFFFVSFVAKREERSENRIFCIWKSQSENRDRSKWKLYTKLHRHADVCHLVNRLFSCHISCIVLVLCLVADTTI